ncbi:MAG: ribonuclease P protein component 4 [Candidatus Methanomethylophilaceae archaeon]|nr:ribonuclease P protein component 4 [Candidatus Methanomethylophilaceae archaeon]
MSKRRVSNKTIAEIGSTRIAKLMDLSEDAVRAGNTDRARRYVWLARRIGMKTRVGMPRDRMYCKGCMVPLVPGVSCTVRLSDHRICTTCGMCGTVRRRPYIREQRT